MLKSRLAKIKLALNDYFAAPARRLLWLIVLVLALVAVPYFVNSSSRACLKEYRQDVVITIGTAELAAEIAREPADREKGLSGRDCIGSQQAMLFSFEKMGTYPFWMKNMKFPIDIVWINADLKVVDIEANVQPSSFPKTFYNDEPAQYVLELQAGRAAELHMQQGTQIAL